MKGIGVDESAIPLLYRHSVALVDGVVPLVARPSVESMRILMRAFLEAKCCLEYILEKNTTQRAVAYQTKHIISKIEYYRAAK